MREEYGWMNKDPCDSEWFWIRIHTHQSSYPNKIQTTLSAFSLPQTTSYPLPHCAWNCEIRISPPPNRGIDWAETPNATLLLAGCVGAFARFQILLFGIAGSLSNPYSIIPLLDAKCMCWPSDPTLNFCIHFFTPLFVVFLHLLCLHVCLCPPKCCFGSHFVSSVITLEESMAVRLGCCAFVMIWLV